MDRLSKLHFGLLTCFLVSAVFIFVTQECKKTTAMIETAEESGNELRVSKKQERKQREFDVRKMCDKICDR